MQKEEEAKILAEHNAAVEANKNLTPEERARMVE